jgi:glycosyltransferase involved in cell wall biosynthesis
MAAARMRGAPAAHAVLVHPDFPMTASDQSMGLIHVVDSLEFGGLERVVSDLAIAQAAAGHRVAVFSINETRGFRPVLEAAGVPVVVGAKRGTLDIAVLRRLRAAVSACRIDVIHTHNFVPNYYAALATFAAPRRPVLVNTVHNMGTRLAQRRLRWLYRWSLTRTARVAMVGAQVRDHFVGAGIVSAARASTVLNGIPVERFNPSAARRAAARTALGVPPDALVVGCIGRLVAVKNHRLLLAQIRALLPKYPRLHVVSIGEGPLDGELRAQANALGITAQVSFLGARADVADLLPGLDIFALPSLSEGLSIALLEACASGLAIVATAVGGNPEIVEDGSSGCLVPSNDGRALEQVLDTLLGDAQLRARLGAAASAWVRTHASIEVMRDAYARFYVQARATG